MQVTHPVVSDRSQLFDSANFQSLVKQIALFRREGVQEDKKTLYGLQDCPWTLLCSSVLKQFDW